MLGLYKFSAKGSTNSLTYNGVFIADDKDVERFFVSSHSRLPAYTSYIVNFTEDSIVLITQDEDTIAMAQNNGLIFGYNPLKDNLLVLHEPQLSRSLRGLPKGQLNIISLRDPLLDQLMDQSAHSITDQFQRMLDDDTSRYDDLFNID